MKGKGAENGESQQMTSARVLGKHKKNHNKQPKISKMHCLYVIFILFILAILAGLFLFWFSKLDCDIELYLYSLFGKSLGKFAA